MEGGKKLHYYRPGKETPETGEKESKDEKKTDKGKGKTGTGRLLAQKGRREPLVQLRELLNMVPGNYIYSYI